MNRRNGEDLYGRYSIVIEWSDEDGVYVVTLPEFGCHTHGTTREEALENAQEVLELLIEPDNEDARPLPRPKLFEFAELEDIRQEQFAS